MRRFARHAIRPGEYGAGAAVISHSSRRGTSLPERDSVFVVDDDPSIRTSVNRLLREHGFAATLFDSAGALLHHGSFDKAICIVLDIDLNGRSGIDLRRQLAEEGVTAPVIYITGNDSSANRAAAVASGCIAYLVKPFTAQSLIESVARASAA
ncbi:FixJ family two-component response regulator [Bradyrhizobium sp. LA6.10]|jgi:FixJ family two-component response regulator